MQLNIRTNGKVTSMPAYTVGTNPYLHNLHFRTASGNACVPLMQDTVNSNVHVRVANGIYCNDPYADPTNVFTGNKLMHLKNVKGALKDLTGRTSWAASQVSVPGGNDGRIVFGNAANNRGYLALNNSTNICVYNGNFTVLIDFLLYGKNNFKLATDNTSSWYNAHEFMSGGNGTFMIRLRDNLQSVLFGCTSANNAYCLERNLPFALAVNKEHRLIIQRKSNFYDGWIDGVHAFSGLLKVGNICNAGQTIIGARGDKNQGNINGHIRNFVIWNRAVYDTNENCTHKVWWLWQTQAAFGGDAAMSGDYLYLKD